jgi:hypothetical protein
MYSPSASPSLGQAVFATNSQSFSISDLAAFQLYYGYPNHPALSQGTVGSASCGENECGEGNLDLQFIMGAAQETPTTFWFTDGSSGTSSSPFVDFLVSVGNLADPPTTLSISYGSYENVRVSDL